MCGQHDTHKNKNSVYEYIYIYKNIHTIHYLQSFYLFLRGANGADRIEHHYRSACRIKRACTISDIRHRAHPTNHADRETPTNLKIITSKLKCSIFSVQHDLEIVELYRIPTNSCEHFFCNVYLSKYPTFRYRIITTICNISCRMHPRTMISIVGGIREPKSF